MMTQSNICRCSRKRHSYKFIPFAGVYGGLPLLLLSLFPFNSLSAASSFLHYKKLNNEDLERNMLNLNETSMYNNTVGISSNKYGQGSDQYDENQYGEDEDVAGEWLETLIFSLIFGIIISLIGACFGYYAMKEFQLMKKYKESGNVVTATIMSSTFARSYQRHWWDFLDKDKRNERCITELLLVVEYSQELAENYMVGISKHVKAREVDILKTYPGKNQSIKNYQLNNEVAWTNQIVMGKKNGSCDNLNTKTLFSAKSSFSHIPQHVLDLNGVEVTRFLELYVLPDLPKSGLPKTEIERIINWKHHASILFMVIFNYLIVIWISLFAINYVSYLESDEKRDLGWRLIITYFILLLLEFLSVYTFFDRIICEALEEEFFLSGELVKHNNNDSSLSSLSSVE